MKKITIIGGDNRLKILKDSLVSQGYLVDTLGLFENDNGNYKTSQIIILPVPTTKDNKTIFTPLTNRTINLFDIANSVTNQQLILSCNYSFEGKNFVDYGSLDSYALLNAVPTAEGAIKIAIENTDFTLWNSNILVIGYGRVGKILAERLKSLGANVTVSARKPADMAQLSALGFNYINTEKLNETPLGYDIIMNTVDVKVIDDNSLKTCTANLILDLSSLGGFSLEKAKEYGINALKAPGLPGLVAPYTAAQILSKTVTHIINSYN